MRLPTRLTRSGHGFCRLELERGTLLELTYEEARPEETFWLAWKPGPMGQALKWWLDRLERPLVPALLPR